MASTSGEKAWYVIGMKVNKLYYHSFLELMITLSPTSNIHDILFTNKTYIYWLDFIDGTLTLYMYVQLTIGE